MTAAESTLLDTAEVLVRAGMLTSKSELRRLLMQGGVSLNGEIPQVRRREEKLSRTEKFCSMHRPIRSKSSEYSTGKKHRFVTMENGWNF